MTRLKREKLLSTGYEAVLQAVEMLREESLLRLLLPLRHEAQLRQQALPLQELEATLPLRALPLPEEMPLRLRAPPLRAPPLLEPAVRAAEAPRCPRQSMAFRSGKGRLAESPRSI